MADERDELILKAQQANEFEPLTDDAATNATLIKWFNREMERAQALLDLQGGKGFRPIALVLRGLWVLGHRDGERVGRINAVRETQVVDGVPEAPGIYRDSFGGVWRINAYDNVLTPLVVPDTVGYPYPMTPEYYGPYRLIDSEV